MNIQILIFFLVSISIFFNTHCTPTKPYPDYTRPMLEYYKSGDMNNAYLSSNNTVQFSKNGQSQDYYLTLLERGKIALAKEDFDAAIHDLQVAEQRFLNIEGTISIKEEASSLIINDSVKEYQPEPQELVLISPYLALAYLAKYDYNGARVERNRTINKINEYIEKSGKKYLENPFARYISALIYEMDGLNDDARIEYEKISKKNKHLKYMKNEINKLSNIKTTDLVVIADVGLAPQKYEEIYGPIKHKFNNRFLLIAFSYAKMKSVPSLVDHCNILINGQIQGSTNLLYNLEKTILTHFDKNSNIRLKKMLERIILKKAMSLGLQYASKRVKNKVEKVANYVGKILEFALALTEKADLRQWRTLPKNIQYMRIRNVPTGYNQVIISFNGGNIIRNTKILKNKINFIYVSIPK